MKTFIAVFTIIISCSTLYAKDIQLFNTDSLGQSSSSTIKLLQEKKSDETEPFQIKTDIKCGIYYAASVFYPKNVSFYEARESLNKLYKEFEKVTLLRNNKIATWRNGNKGFSIQLTNEKKCIRINYIHFKSVDTYKDCFRSLDSGLHRNDIAKVKAE